jgi:hypothetical protein
MKPLTVFFLFLATVCFLLIFLRQNNVTVRFNRSHTATSEKKQKKKMSKELRNRKKNMVKSLVDYDL